MGAFVMNECNPGYEMDSTYTTGVLLRFFFGWVGWGWGWGDVWVLVCILVNSLNTK